MHAVAHDVEHDGVHDVLHNAASDVIMARKKLHARLHTICSVYWRFTHPSTAYGRKIRRPSTTIYYITNDLQYLLIIKFNNQIWAIKVRIQAYVKITLRLHNTKLLTSTNTSGVEDIFFFWEEHAWKCQNGFRSWIRVWGPPTSVGVKPSLAARRRRLAATAGSCFFAYVFGEWEALQAGAFWKILQIFGGLVLGCIETNVYK